MGSSERMQRSLGGLFSAAVVPRYWSQTWSSTYVWSIEEGCGTSQKEHSILKSEKFSATSQHMQRTRGAQMRSASLGYWQVLREDEGDQLCLQKDKLL